MEFGLNIAVVGFGSIVNNLYSVVYDHTLEIEGNFSFPAKEELSLPIRMSRLSSTNTPERRITVVVDPNATPERVGVAKSAKNSLKAALIDLQKREGTTLNNICYLAKNNLAGLDELAPPHQVTLDNTTYKGKLSGKDSNYKLTEEQTKKIAHWLKNSGYDAIIWTGLPPNISTTRGNYGSRGREIIPLLQGDQTLLINTQAYIRNLPEIFRTSLQNKILSGDLT
jgi:hypothetical protein